MASNNKVNLDPNLMTDEQFLAYQMQLARVEGADVPMDMDENLNDNEEFEPGYMYANNLPNRGFANVVSNQIVPQDDQNRRQAGEDGHQPGGGLGADVPPNQILAPGNNQARNGGIAQDNNRDVQGGNNLDGNQAGNQGNNGPDNRVVEQRNAHANNQGDGRGNQARFQAPHQVVNNAAPGNGNRVIGFGNFAQPRPFIHGALQAYPQGHAVYGQQQGLNQNFRNPPGFGRQRFLNPVELAQAERLKRIIYNLENELRLNREVYKRLYGFGGLKHDAGYWKNKFMQEKRRNSNRGRNMFFFNNK